jgi:hypothetical protein
MVTRDPSFDQDDPDRGINDGRVYWASALSYIAKLNTENYLGFHNWRLPNRKELLSLVNYGQILQTDWLNANGFSNFGSGMPWVWYWSSSTRYASTNCAFALLHSGILDYIPKTNTLDQNALVIAVRDGK